jgi:RHS repeat-associated protein
MTMNRDHGVALSRLLFFALLFGVALSLTLPFWSRPVYATDSDSDGLSDTFENAFGTDPYSAHSDGDSLTDWQEIYEYGTDPNMADTDGDGTADHNDADPLDNGNDAGGRTSVDYSFAVNGTAASPAAHRVGFGVDPITGGMRLPVHTVDFGPGYYGRNQLNLVYDSRITANLPFGMNILTNWDHFLVVNGSSASAFFWGFEIPFTQVGAAWEQEGQTIFCCDLELDTPNQLYVLTFNVGGGEICFDSTSGLLMEYRNRFGDATTLTRNGSGEVTAVTFPEGNTVTVDRHATGRISDLTDWNSPTARTWSFSYNCCDQLAQIGDALGHTRQFRYWNGSTDGDLNNNLSQFFLADGHKLLEVDYDSSDRVISQIPGEESNHESELSYSATTTDVTDFGGNDIRYTFSAGELVPASVVRYSNRDVRAGDPATWTTTYAYDSDDRVLKTVLPKGNRIDFEYDAYGCLTEIRKKATDTDTDNNTTDYVTTMTYGSTYHQLEDSTDPRGNTTERTLDADELVTQIDYPDLTHPDPDQSISESFTWNSHGQLLTHTDGEGVVTKYDYYASGTETGLLWKKTVDYGVSGLNLVTELEYDDYRYLSSVTDPDGNESTRECNALGQVTGTVSAGTMDYEVEYDYGVNGTLSEKRVENVDQDETRDTGHPWITTTYQQDVLGRVTSVQEEIATGTTRTTSFTYSGLGELIQIDLPAGNCVVQVFDERGMLASRTRGYGTGDASNESFEYDGNLNLVSYVNGRSKEYEQTFNDYDQLTGAETPLGHYVTFVVDKNGNRSEIKRYDSSDTLLAHRKQYFDELNQVYKIEDWLDNTAPAADEWLATEIERDDRGLVILVTDPEYHETENTWDPARRLICQEDHLGNKVEYDFTDDFLVPTQIDQVEVVPGGGTQTFVVEQVTDALHRVIERSVVDRNNSSNKHTTSFDLDYAGISIETEDAEGNLTWLSHDFLGQILKKEVDLGNSEEITTEWEFDENGNLVLLTDDAGNETIYRYNARDVLEETEYDDGEKRTLSIAADDLVAGWTDENGTVVVNTLDDDGRITARAITRAAGVLGPTSESYAYDGLNRLTEATNNNSTVQRAYDTLSRLVSETQGPNPIGTSGKTISYTYNDDGSRATCEYFSGYDLVYTSDAVGRWTKIEDASSNDLVTQSFYGPGFRSYQVDYLNGTQTTIGYDGFRMPTDIDHADSGSTVFSGFDYAFDKMGNPTYVEFTHDSGQGNLYAYDQAYRLTSAQMGSADPSAEAADEDWGDYAYVQKLDFNMDDDSNRGSVVTTPYGQGSSTESYTADNLNQYTVIASVNQTHDDNGNLTDDGTCDLAYDYRNNLIQVISSSVVLSSCEFDPLGRRSKQVTGDGSYTTLYFYDGEHVVEEFDGSDDLLRKFVYGQRIDEIRVMIAPDYADVDDDSNTTEVLHFYYHTDMLGTVTHITDESENVVESYEYTPYGQTTIKDGTGTAISGSDILNPYMFTARRLDEDTGLYHYRRRAYSPERGRFLQRDPLGYVDSLCAYEYVKSQPIRFVDPTGQGLKDWAVKLFKEVASGMNIPLQVAALAEAVAPYFEANEENLDNIRDEADRRLNPELAMRRYTTQGKVIQVGLMPGVENYVKGLIVGIASWFNPTLFFADGVSKLLPPNSK